MYMESLRYLLEISKCKSLSEASQNLYMTPQALSISMKNLESELGIQLLNRSNHGVTLTEDGWRLSELTENYLRSIYDLTHKPQNSLLSYNGDLNIYTNIGGANLFFPILTGYIYRNLPSLKINLHTMTYRKIVNKVQAAKIPYGFLDQYYIKGKPALSFAKDLQFYPLFRTRITCYIPDKYPIYHHQMITLDDLISYPLIITDNTLTLLNILQYQNNCSQVYHAENPAMVKSFLNSGLGIALQIALPYQEVDHFHVKNVRIIPLGGEVDSYFGYILNPKQDTIPPIAQALLDYIMNNLQDILTK